MISVRQTFQAIAIAGALVDLTEFSDPTTLTASILADLGATLTGFPPSFTNDLGASAILGAMDDIKGCYFGRGQVAFTAMCNYDDTSTTIV